MESISKSSLQESDRIKLHKRSTSSRNVNLKYENFRNHNPFVGNKWPGSINHNHSSINQTKSTQSFKIVKIIFNLLNLNQKVLGSFSINNEREINRKLANITPNSNANLLISNYLDQHSSNKHKYFLPSSKASSVFGLNVIQSNLQQKPPKNLSSRSNSSKSVIGHHPIINNGFLRPQVVQNHNSNLANKSEVSSSGISINSKTSFGSKRAKSSINYKLGNNSGNNSSTSSVTSFENNRIDTLLGSKNARDAFFERLRVTEYLKKSKPVENVTPRLNSCKSFLFDIFYAMKILSKIF